MDKPKTALIVNERMHVYDTQIKNSRPEQRLTKSKDITSSYNTLKAHMRRKDIASPSFNYNPI